MVCKEVLPTVDAIVYAAYSISEDTLNDRRVNYEGLREILSAVKTNKIIFLSSIAVFGTCPEEKEHDEDSPKRGETSYQKDKIDACNFLQGLSSKISVIVFYLAIVYDIPCKRFDDYRSLLNSGYLANGDVENGLYNLVHACDVAKAVVVALRTDSLGGYDEYIVCSESIKYTEYIRLLEVYFGIQGERKVPHIFAPITRGPVRKVLRFLGFRSPLFIPQPKYSQLNNSATFSSTKIQDDFNWAPSYSLQKLVEENKY